MFTTRFRWSFYSTAYVASYTGFLLIFFMTKPTDFFPKLRHMLLKTHIVSVMLWLFTCGMLFSIHVFPQLQARVKEGRRSGISLVFLVIAMTLSGYALQVLPWQNLLASTRWLHVITGSAFVLLLIGHLLLIKAEIRKWLVAAVGAGILLALPFFTLQQNETFPDEIRLTPQSDAGQKKNP